jgi:hypothetical protein
MTVIIDFTVCLNYNSGWEEGLAPAASAWTTCADLLPR